MKRLVLERVPAARLHDQALTQELGRLAGCERESTAALVAHLAEFDARRLYEGEGLRSVFMYCTIVLRLSEDSAYNRIQAAREARKYPVILERLAAGTLSVTTVRLLAPRLTPENHETLLTAADGKGKHAVEQLLATWFPQPDVPPSVRRVPVRTAAGHAVPSPATIGSEPRALPVLENAGVGAGPAAAEPSALTATLPATPPRPSVRPLAAERYAIRFTASAETLEKLRTAQDLLGHAVPSGDLAEVFDRALTVLIADLARKKFAATSRPRPTTTSSTDERHIPAAVKRVEGTRSGTSSPPAREGVSPILPSG